MSGDVLSHPADDRQGLVPAGASSPLVRSTDWRALTPARLMVGRVGGSYRTATYLALKADHSAALDAVHTEFDLAGHLGADVVARFGLFEVQSQAESKADYLLHPEKGRQLSADDLARLRTTCPARPDLQLVIGDGLSPLAVAAQCPVLLPRLVDGATARGWKVGQTFAVRYCRVGILNDVGATLDPEVVVLLIGERPGLATAESLSAYCAYRPRPDHTDANRNLISNIHARGIPIPEAAERILALVAQMRSAATSGVAIKETLAMPRRLGDGESAGPLQPAD